MKSRFYTTEMGAVGRTRWFDAGEELPSLDWSKVTAIETSEEVTVEEFRKRFPDVHLPEPH